MRAAADDPRFPIGRFEPLPALDADQRQHHLSALTRIPAAFRRGTQMLSTEQLLTPYRSGGWTVAQVVHHMADSHMNGYVRCRLALTEDLPLVRTYEEAGWAELSDARGTDLLPSLILLEVLHQRWVALLGSLSPTQWRRAFRHPEWGTVTLEWALQEYAWHGEHHLVHITRLGERLRW